MHCTTTCTRRNNRGFWIIQVSQSLSLCTTGTLIIYAIVMETYIDLVEILLNMVRASREGHWELHLCAIEQMIPWCFAYDNINYARYLPAYLSEMIHLQEAHPDAYEYLKSGGVSVQITTTTFIYPQKLQVQIQL